MNIGGIKGRQSKDVMLPSMFGIYVLHCPRVHEWRDDCYNRIFQVFNRYPVTIKGIRPDNLGSLKIDYPVDPAGVEFSIGSMLCTYGHRQILSSFLKSNNDVAIIFEDDVVFHDGVTGKDFQDCIKCVESIDPEWDWMTLEVPSTYEGCYAILKDGHDKIGVRIDSFNKVCELYRCSMTTLGAYCYAVSRKGARRIIELTYPFKEAIDCVTSNGGNGNVYYGPELCTVYPYEESLINSTSTLKEWLNSVN